MATEKSVATVKPKPAAPAPTSGPSPLDRSKKYLGEVQTELKKTTWPTKPELISQTQVVFVLLVVVGVFIAGWDFILGQFFRLVLQLMGVRH
jgi:preprotein translocase subunit SecE